MPEDRPVAWSVAADSPAAMSAPAGTPATRDDLTDAAQSHDGGGRLARRRLARALLARLANVPVAEVRLSRTALGALIVVSPPGWYVGQSGRGGDWLIGAARRPIAVDREPLDDAPPLRDMLSPSEIEALDRLAPADRPLDWLRRWTIKEAHAKLIGDPLRIRPETIETRLDTPVEATATFEGVSRCWTRTTATAIETVAMWT
ncbi:4'-phosphopantetheinyl transferase superfamily protein [uncultured Sphingomonas sp.]|uniref:4'-phosphopantetheinyl transferase superfamily protein n=1 Tax=uncultured Sphingomonas sp. TaxID=158754 RepID=UPI0035C9D682